MSGIMVLPRSATLSDKGSIWEGRLFHAGWNELPEKDKPGEITCCLSDGSVDIRFPGASLTVEGVYLDEIRVTSRTQAGA